MTTLLAQALFESTRGVAPTLFGLRADDYWVMATAVVCAVACAVLGCFLVLRRLSLLGDAISHAILPGLALAFIVTGSRDIVPMLIGAMVVGLLTAAMTSALARMGRVPEDAAMGVVFSSLFALGVLLISQVAHNVDLDPGCVLYGLIEFTPLDKVLVLGFELPRAFGVLSVVMVINLALITVFYKELKIVSFDPYLATTMGINATLVHYGLMAAVAGTTVASFEAVGSILVVAMLIAPAASAQLLTDRLARMLWISALLAVIAAVVGYLLALYWNTSVAGMMSVVAGGEFAAAVFLAPNHGLVSKALRQSLLALRIRREDILGTLYRQQEAGAGGGLGHRGDGLIGTLAIFLLRRAGHVEGAKGARSLSTSGQAKAGHIIRSHRLWETYLSRKVGLPTDHVHDPSERMEHFITKGLEQDLSQEFEGGLDPQGKRIPPP